MATIFSPTESKSLFVGRQAELDIFAQVLTGQRPEWIMHFPGSGGIGKTRLLERFREYAQQQEKLLITTDLVDFYKTANQTGFGLLQEITRQLDSQYFPAFADEREQFVHLLETAPDPGERQEGANRVTEAFLKDYASLLHQGYRILLLFDTCEEMRAVEPYVLNLLVRIGQIEHKLAEETRIAAQATPHYLTTVVVVGRKRLDFPPQLTNQVLIQELPPMTDEEVQEFFQQGGMDAETVNAEAIARLHQLTGGRPLYVALSYDWLKNEVGALRELLALEEPFGQTLVGWVRRLDSGEKQAILYTALAWRRMEASLLARLLGTSESEALQLIEQLSRFSFVKYRPAGEGFPGSFQLHDEMRDLILRHVWPQAGQLTQEALLPQIVAWYEEQIGAPELLSGNKLPPTDEARALLAEWLFYQCRIDLQQAFMHHEQLFRNAVHYLDLAFCDLLNQEMERFAAAFSPSQQDDLRFREALAAFRREQFEHASSIWHSLLRRPDLKESIRATTLMLLVELDGYTGRPDEALGHAQEGEQIYQRLIETDPAQREHWQAELGLLYNNWGYVYRVKGDLPRALEYYRKVLGLPGRPKNVARTLNNIGYVYFQQGDMVQARTYVGRALQMRRQLQPPIPYELGLGYNTMGIIMEQSGRLDDAVDLYHKALLNFEAARSERGQALVLLNLGRIERITNKYDAALEYLERARQVFEKKKDEDYLITALNELGCTYRQRGGNGDWGKAEELLKASLALAEQFGKTFNQADNWEDLTILHERWASGARRQGNMEKAQEQARAAREASQRVSELAERYGHTYLLAKNQRTLGDLEYAEGNFASAFEHYLEACRLMARAIAESKQPQVQLQRRYEEMVDRLQERLQGLPSLEETQRYAQQVVERLRELNLEEQQQLQSTADFLQAVIRAAREILPSPH